MSKGFTLYPISGGVCAPRGFIADGVAAGLKKDNALDMAFIYAKEGFSVEALFTSNTFAAAPIVHFRQYVAGKKSNFVLITTKNANAMTGKAGVEDICEILKALQKRFPCVQNPIMSSTGVIGVRLPKQQIIGAFESFELESSPDSHKRASDAIRTTDAFSKEIALEVELENGKSFRIGAMAKGAGMIAPSLATMLCFITTDAPIPPAHAQRLLQTYAKKNFDAISVDGDMSTNDSVFLLSNGASGVYDEEAFGIALERITHKLALDIVRDGDFLWSARAYDEMEEALRKADMLDEWADWSAPRERAVLYNCKNNQMLSLLYHVRNSLCHGRFTFFKRNRAVWIALEDVAKSGKGSPAGAWKQLSARMILRHSTLLSWQKLILAGPK